MSTNFCTVHCRYHRPYSKAAKACEDSKIEDRLESTAQVLLRHVSYRHGARDFIFHAKVPVKGRDPKNVEIVVPTEFLQKLGANLNDSRIEGHGHALWHVENPDKEIPCWSCSDEGKRIAESRQNAIEAEVSPAKLGNGD